MPSRYSKGPHSALVEITENIKFARQFTAGLDVAAFSGDLRTVYAVTRHPSVPWEKIKAAGNIYRHEYDNVSPEILWTTVDEALHDLERAVKTELKAIVPD